MHVSQGEEGPVLRCVATDGHRLARIDAPLPQGAADMPGVIVPKKTVAELRKLLDDDDMQIAVSVTVFLGAGLSAAPCVGPRQLGRHLTHRKLLALPFVHVSTVQVATTFPLVRDRRQQSTAAQHTSAGSSEISAVFSVARKSSVSSVTSEAPAVKAFGHRPPT